jgi:Flp pilus assembly protein TadD
MAESCLGTVGGVLRLTAGAVGFLFIGGMQATELIGVYCAELWRTKQLLYGLPALLVGGTAIGLGTASWLSTDSQVIKRYLVEADRGLRDQEYAIGRTCYRKALALGDSRPVVRFNLALCLDGLGQRAGAEAMIKPLVDPQQTGFAPARMWRARELLGEAGVSTAAMQEVVLQLQRALQQQPDLVEADVMLGQLYYARGRPEEAEPHFRRAAVVRPGLRLILAKYYLERGDKDEAFGQASDAWGYFRPKAEAGDETALLACGQAGIFMETYKEAATVLRRGLDVHDTLPVRRSLAAVYAAWARSKGSGLNADAESQLNLIQQGLRFSPADLVLLQLLLDLTKKTGGEAAVARETWQKLLTEKMPSWIVHILLGLDDWQRGEHKSARVHLEQAHRLSPESGWVANNLAWMLLKGDPPDLERALALADAAVKQAPEDPRFRDTRGQILLNLERWQDALADLELALRGREDNPGVHEALATAYDKLGMSDIALKHRRLAEGKPARQ